MARYKAYPEYKDSGVEWLGKLPDHWTTLAIKHVAQINPSKSCISIEKMKGMCSFIPMEKLKFNSLSLDETKNISDVYNGYTYFENEDILIAKVTPCFENKNMVVAHDLHNGIGFGSSEIYVLRCNDIINNDFLFYRLQEDNFMSIAEGAMTGAGGLKRVPLEVLNNFKFGLPSKKEQSIVVDFLKQETAKIDNLIEKQQQLIELLKEKRQAVISHAVTKGLNPDVPMKDSGVEWLGNIPDDWQLKQIRHLCTSNGGGTPSKSNPKFWIGNIPWVSPKDMKVQYISDAEDHISEDAVKQSSTKKIPIESVLIVVRGMILAHSVPVAINTKVVTINQDMKALIPNNNISCDYLHLVLIGLKRILLEVTDNSAHGTKCLRTDLFEKMWVPLPPLKQQHMIVSEINERIIKIDDLIYLQEEAKALLQERRTALISAAVTGKIDVRDWIAPDTNNAEAPQEASV